MPVQLSAVRIVAAKSGVLEIAQGRLGIAPVLEQTDNAFRHDLSSFSCLPRVRMRPTFFRPVGRHALEIVARIAPADVAIAVEVRARGTLGSVA